MLLAAERGAIMDSANRRETPFIADSYSDVETSEKVAMPRGMKQPPCAKEQCFKVIDIDSLSSSAGSRSGAFGDDESMSDLVASIASLLRENADWQQPNV